MTREVSLPIAALAPYVRHIMAGGFDGERVHLPACADVQLLVYLRGGAWLVDPSGAETPLPPGFLVGAVTHPRRYRVEPDSRFVALTFRPGGLHACLGLSAADVAGRILECDAAIGIAGTGREQDAPERLQDMLLQSLALRTASGSVAPPLLLTDVSRPVNLLAREMGLSVRQFERRCLASLGMPMREYRKLARYSAAMTALMLQGAAPPSLASLAHDAGYVDQSHFTRDFSAMVGQPPGRYIQRRTEAQYQLWQFTREELESYLN